MILQTLLVCLVAAVTDGDSIRCQDGTRLRLAGIDAPEMSHCRRGRVCAPGDPRLSRDHLRRLAGPRVSYRVVDADRCKRGFQSADRYGRPVVQAFARGVDLGVAQLRGGYAIKWRCR